MRGIAPLFILILAAGALVVSGLGYGGYHLVTTEQKLKSDLASTSDALASTTHALAVTDADRTAVAEALDRERERSGSLETKVTDITSTVETLTKLTQTDKELLQKYSRVYFLNENYIPRDFTSIGAEYLYDAKKPVDIHAKVLPYLERMLDDADDWDNPMRVISGYRSFKTQAALKTSYRVTFGSGSNSFSADQGYSEHQLGTTVDLTTPELGANFTGFAKSKSYAWMTENAYRYGFILSYPRGNTYYQYEPWHWRFVGTTLAKKLHDEEKRFYDLPQREIDTFLISIFD